ncbi:hypothetical protein MNB_SV-12-31 [hydrothermal vent metagenome]|uniref:Serine aminopeptidase S33 domain-containing protein n=1 Tax=hydrothermal vent metagenome TaxID=652676 RepID=A0A1W1BGK2_9ZZZZ
MKDTILKHEAISKRYFYPSYQSFENPYYVKSGDNSLACYYHKIDNPRKTIIYFHGNGEVVADYVDFFENKIEKLLGCSILFAEYRGYGLSTGGSPNLVDMLDDVKVIIESIDVPLEEIVLFGRSVGSIYALHGASIFPNIAGLVLESGISNVVSRVLKMIKKTKKIGTTKELLFKEGEIYFNHEKKIKTFQGETLIMHSRFDSLVSSVNAKNLFSWANEPKKLKLFFEGDHNDILSENEEEYFKLLDEFISRLCDKTSVHTLPNQLRKKY